MNQLAIIIAMTLLTAFAHPISLEESVSHAMEHNRELLMAGERVAIADLAHQEIRGSFLPQISLSGGYSLTRTYLPDSTLPSPVDLTVGINPATASDNDYYLAGAISGIANSLIPVSPLEEGALGLSLKLEQLLFSGGQLHFGAKALERYKEVQRLSFEATRRELALQTTKLFYSYLLADELVGVQNEALATAESHLARVEAFAAEGMVAEFDLLRAKLEIAKLKPQLLQAQNTRELALAAFRTLIGDPDGAAVPEGGFPLPVEIGISEQEAIQRGLSARPEILMARTGTEIKELMWKSEKGTLLPKLGLQASASVYTAADEFAIENDDFGTSYAIGIGVSVPLFTGLKSLARSRAAKHEYLLARLQAQDYEDKISLEITHCLQKLRFAEENLKVQEKNIEMAERGLQLAQVRYANQVGIQLEVFDARTILSAMKLQYFQAVFDVIAATCEFKKAIGEDL